MQQRLAHRRAMHLELGDRRRLVALTTTRSTGDIRASRSRSVGSAAPRSSCTRANRTAEPIITSVAPQSDGCALPCRAGRHRSRDGRASGSIFQPPRHQARDQFGQQCRLAEPLQPARPMTRMGPIMAEAPGDKPGAPLRLQRRVNYSAGCIRPDGGAAATLPLAFSSSSHRLWCCLAQFSSTVPSVIDSNAPSSPKVPM